jgi:hypothetical protein
VFALVPCRACLRHVKSSEVSCPFCGAAAPASSFPSGAASSFPSGAAYPRLAAAAAVAASVVTLTSCRSSTATSPPEVGINVAPPYGGVPLEFECTSAAACLPGQLCCYNGSFISQCQAGPCPLGGGQGQLCAISAECGPGETCGTPSQPLPMSGLRTCNPPPDGGAEDASPVDAGDAGDGADGGESPGTTNADAGD